MGGMEKLDDGQRYIVTIEVLGPQGVDQAIKVNKIVADLKNDPTLKAIVKVSINGLKPHKN